MNKATQLNGLVSSYINTSVDDMKSSLKCAEKNHTLKSEVLQMALVIVTKRNEKTKINVLNRYIRRMIKNGSGNHG